MRALTAERDGLKEALADIRDFSKGIAVLYEVFVRADAALARGREEGT